MKIGSWALAATLILSVTAPSAANSLLDNGDDNYVNPWEPCALCHSLDGNSRMAKFPKLAGMSADYIRKQLDDFRLGRRKNDNDQMQGSAIVAKAKDVAAIATYFAGLPPPPPAESPAPAIVDLAGNLAHYGDKKRGLKPCLSCHDSAGVLISGAPRIESQHATYISKQLHDFKARVRHNDLHQVMESVASKLSDDEISALGRYFASRKRE